MDYAQNVNPILVHAIEYQEIFKPGDAPEADALQPFVPKCPSRPNKRRPPNKGEALFGRVEEPFSRIGIVQAYVIRVIFQVLKNLRTLKNRQGHLDRRALAPRMRLRTRLRKFCQSPFTNGVAGRLNPSNNFSSRSGI